MYLTLTLFIHNFYKIMKFIRKKEILFYRATLCLHQFGTRLYIPSDNSHFANDSDTHYVSDIKLPRNNSDTKRLVNSGKSLISLCRESGLRIINGRMIFIGNFTSIHCAGP